MNKICLSVILIFVTLFQGFTIDSQITNDATIESWRKYDDSSIFYGKIIHNFNRKNRISIWMRKKDNIYYHAEVVFFDHNENSNERYFMFETFPDSYIIETFIAERNYSNRKRLKPIMNNLLIDKSVTFKLSDNNVYYVGTWIFSPTNDETSEDNVRLEIINEIDDATNYYIEKGEAINYFEVLMSLPGIK